MSIAEEQEVARPPSDPLLHIELVRAGDVVDVRLIGEMDLSTRGQVVAAIERARLDGATQVRLDLAELHFCDASGLAELVAAREILASQQREFAALSAQPSVLRLLTICGLAGLFALLPS